MNPTKSFPRAALAFLALALFAATASAQNAAAENPFRDQATAIVQPLRFADNDKTERAAQLTANYLRQIDVLTAQRRAALEASGQATPEAPEVNHQTADAWQVCRDSTAPLRDAFAAQLAAIMPPALVDRVKDGITRDAYHHELQRFDRLAPNLSYPEKAHIAGLLVEMRENAMLEIDPKLQTQWVHKYRGIINNYIAAQGYDFHALAKAYRDTYENPAP